MISIVDYGLGNVQAIANIYKRLNIPAQLVSTASALAEATRLVLPGVGAFDWAMSRLNDSGMRETLDHLVLRDRRPVLGICVGMQMMAHRSEEGVQHGLGWIDGVVKRFDEAAFHERTHLPHMGWNDVAPRQPGGLFAGIETESRFYFLHSYHIVPANAADVIAYTDYNVRFASSIRHDNVFGTQFHPEKSHHWGVRLLRNFAEL
ncbi:MAG: imidazole glycerol phosphate synthase subunit HisH [Cyanobacteria bacterium]|nr:imidazole glycerol phosphate synthase subunit HisH [Cyanobacteriota bacterium]